MSRGPTAPTAAHRCIPQDACGSRLTSSDARLVWTANRPETRVGPSFGGEPSPDALTPDDPTNETEN